MQEAALQSLVHELTELPAETEWVEFKHSNADPQEIGEYVSALSNSAALCGRPYGYLLWGVKDGSHDVIGTDFKFSTATKGKQELENWIVTQLNPQLHLQYFEFEYQDRPVVLLEIPAAPHQPVQFRGEEFIRSGSYKKKLKDFPAKERELWRIFDKTPFEELTAADAVTSDDVLRLLDYPSYFKLLDLPLPDGRAGILKRLVADKMITEQPGDLYNITNLGAILFAADLREFPRLERKAMRVVVYKGTGRVETKREHEDREGYAIGFGSVVDYISQQLPENEVIGQAFRERVQMYPELAIRELVANALIHQDFSIRGTGPMVEIFDDRMEITNPGIPLVDTMRFLDEPPQSRNEALAAFMRRISICEERGSGIDKVVFQTEMYQLPAPKFEKTTSHTKAIMYAHRTFSEMDQADRMRACYLHACLKYVSNDFMTNTSLRERFQIDQKNYPMVSKLIRETTEAGLVKPHDPESKSRKHAKYVPFWA